METCLIELQKAVGDRVSEIDLKIAASKFNYNYDQALSALLSDPRYVQRKQDNELPKSIERSVTNGQIHNNNLSQQQQQHNLAQIEHSLLNDDGNDLIKNSLDRVLNQQQQFNQMQYYQLMQQQMRNHQLSQLQAHLPLMVNHPQLSQQQQQQFHHEIQSPHYNHLINSQQPFIPPHIQQLIQQQLQQQNSNANSLGNSSLSDSFASMSLNTNSNLDQNGFNLNNLNGLNNLNNLSNLNNLNNLGNLSGLSNLPQTGNLRNNFLVNQQLNHQPNKSGFMNGSSHSESTPVKRALTLEEIEQGLLEERKANEQPKRMTLEDLESTLLFDLKTTPEQEDNSIGLNINNLNEFPKLDSNEFPKITKTLHETEKSIQPPQQQHQFNHNQRSNYNRHHHQNYNNNQHQNFNNNQHQNFNNNQHQNYNNNQQQQQSNQRNQNFRNYHPSLIPNPLNPLEMIQNETMNNKNGYNKPHQNYNNKRNYQKISGYNNYMINRSDDEYAGLMTPKDINWLRRIQHMQLEFDDPYVQDYYYVNYQTRKIAAEQKKRDKMNGEMHSVPQLVIPERGLKLCSNESTTDNPRYIPPDFSGSLGKIRVANVNYPRKLLDFNNKLEKLASKSESVSVEPHGRTELNKFRRLLLDIERNLTNVLKIDHEDKKIAALPHDAQISHLEERKRLCDELFNGILTTDDNKNVNFHIANIRKGCMLIFKALQVLENSEQTTVIISDLLKVDNFHHVVMQKDKTLYCLDYGQVLIDAIKTVKDCDFSMLLRIADGLDDASVVAKFQVIF